MLRETQTLLSETGMSRPLLFSLLALFAAPASALELGTYPVTAGQGSGELQVFRDTLEIAITGPDGCTGAGSGPLLRGAEGAWAAVLTTGTKQCVLVGSPTGFSSVGDGCASMTTGSCQMAGTMTARGSVAAEPIQVIRPLLRGRFNRMDEEDRRAVQTLLAEQGHYAGRIDGAYGDGTESALFAHLQAMADRGEPVDGNSSTFVRETMADMPEAGRALTVPAPASPTTVKPEITPSAGGPIYAGRWSCGGITYIFTADRYQMISDFDGRVLQEGRLRPDGVDGRTAYLELVGFGNLTFFGVGTSEMMMHDPVIEDSWDCVAR